MNKFSKYIIALMPFASVMLIFYVTQYLIYYGLIVLGALLRTGDSLGFAYNMYNSNLNLVSIIIYVMALVPAGLVYYKYFYKQSQPLRENRHIRPSSFGYSVLFAWGMSNSISLLFVFLAIVMPKKLEEYTNMVNSSSLASYSFLWIFSTLILPPLAEEIIFRGLTMRLFRRAGAPFFVANILQAVLFGVFHQNLVQGIYAFILGLALGFITNHYHSLVTAMAFHAAFNLFGTLGVDLQNRFLPGNGFQLIFIALGLCATAAGFILIFNQRPKKHPYGALMQTPYDDTNEPYI